MNYLKKISQFRPHIPGVMGLVFLNIILFGDVLFNNGARILSSSQADIFLHFAAWREFAFDQLRQGHLVLWNPHYLCGAPFLGGFESAILYPPNWLYLLLPLPQAINAGIILHVFLAGFFTYLWAANRGLHPLACFVAGVIFMFGGSYFLHLYAGHLPNLCAMVWAPLIFLAVDGLLGKNSFGWILLGIFAVSMQILAGHPQYVYFTAIMAVIYLLLNIKINSNKSKLVLGLISILTGAGFLTAIQLWTGLQAANECGRDIAMEYHSASSFFFPPENLMTLILPEIFGNLEACHYWGRWFLWEMSLFIGVTAFILAAIGAFGAASNKKRRELILAILAFIFSVGVSTPLYRFFYDYLPLFKGFRGISKFDFLTALFLSMLAAIGLDYLLKAKRIPRWPGFLAMFFGFLMAITGACVFFSLQQGPKGFWGDMILSIPWLKTHLLSLNLDSRNKFIQDAGLHSAESLWVGAATAALLSVFLVFRNSQPKWVYAIAAVSILELFVFARMNRPTFEWPSLQKQFTAFRSPYENDKGDYRVYGTASASLVTGGFDIWEDEPMILARYGCFVCYSQGLPESRLFSVVPIFKKFSKVFALVRLKYLMCTIEDKLQIYTLPFKPLPRMLLMDHWEIVSDPKKILESLFAPEFDPAKKVYLENPPGLAPSTGVGKGSVEWKDLSTDSIEIQATVTNASILLVTDNYSPGWKIWPFPDSGQTQYQVMPGDAFLRAIPLTPGKHHFILEYLPRAFLWGKWVSIFSIFSYVLIMLVWLKKIKVHL